jgi:hypothetical protein
MYHGLGPGELQMGKKKLIWLGLHFQSFLQFEVLSYIVRLQTFNSFKNVIKNISIYGRIGE